MVSVKGKTALITGASSGIGEELARIHAEQGGNLVIVARNEDALNELKSELVKKYGVTVYVIKKDLSLPESPQEVFDEITKQNIQIDFLINNAGFGGIGKFHERDWEQDRKMISVNITALAALTHLFLPGFVARNEGKIMNVSSTASFMPGPLQAVYYASKSFVAFFSNAISEELADTNITVTTLKPGATESKFGAVSGMDKTMLFKKTATSRKVASDGYKAMIKGKRNIVTGFPLPLRIMCGLIPFMPQKMVLSSIRMMQEVK